jgi:hypothetical protein
MPINNYQQSTAPTLINYTLTASIAQDASLSGAVNLAGRAVCSILMSAVWDTAALTFQGSLDGATYGNIYDATTGAEYSIAATAALAGVGITVPPNSPLLGWNYIKVRSGTAASAVNQTTGNDPRVLTIGTRAV